MVFAPVVLFVYNRPEHTRQTIEALQKNELAIKTDLIIFSDGAKNSSGEASVKKVREYLKTVTGFKSVTINEQSKNKGLAKSIISGVTQVIDEYEKVIVMEDDLVSHFQLLTFLNESLVKYENNQKVFSATGFNYSPHVFEIPASYDYSTYFSYRAHSCSWATWKDRWDRVDFEVKDYESFSKNRKQQKLFNRGGQDLSIMLRMQMTGEIDSWAILFCYSHFKHEAYCLYPVMSLIRNIGFDDTATHSKGADERYEVEIHEEPFKYTFPEDVNVDPSIAIAFGKLHILSLKYHLILFYITFIDPFMGKVIGPKRFAKIKSFTKKILNI